MKKRMKKLLALLLAVSMTVWMTGGVYASELSDNIVPLDTALSEDAIEDPSEEGSDTDSSAENGVTAAMTTAVKIREKAEALKSLTPGKDYLEHEGYFLAETQEEAEKVAKEYKAALKSYSHGVAVLEFEENVGDALISAADALTTTTVVEPNHIDHIFGYTDDVAETLQDETFGQNGNDNDAVVNMAGVTAIDAASDAPNDAWANETDEHYQWFHDMINTLKAHELTEGKGVKVAVLDTGINLKSKYTEFASSTEQDYVVRYEDYKGVDYHGHGTNCAGIIGALKNNGYYGYGVAPEVDIYSVQISYDGSIYGSDEVEAVKMAIEKGVQVISMSFGGTYPDEAMEEVCHKALEKGITLVAAAGNETTDLESYPAAFDSVIAVAAANKDGKLSYFSNYGNWVDIVAPGGGKGQKTGEYNLLYEPECVEPSEHFENNNHYLYGENGMQGTSQACPNVAAVAALIYASNSDLTKSNNSDAPEIVKNILLSTTDGKEYSYEGHSVTGLVQADAAAEMAKTYSYNYTMVDQSGDYSAYLKGKICQGGKLKFDIADKTGNIKAAKAAAKTAVWTSDNATVATVKKGKVKCNKAAPVGSTVLITATIGSEKIQCSLTVTHKTLMFGQCLVKISHRGYKYKFQPKRIAYGSLGARYNLRNPYYMSRKNVLLFFEMNKKTGAYTGYKANTNFKYVIKMSKSQAKKCTVETGKGGNIEYVTIKAPGKYTFKYKVIDGSNKTFSYTLKVGVK
ncbi:Subtilase family protein [Lachnospiraceae bacterium]|nr:Subtilase family protein [Lachnospiraceae bacterium]